MYSRTSPTVKRIYQTLATIVLFGSMMSGHANTPKKTYDFGEIAGMASHAAHVRNMPAKSASLTGRMNIMSLASSAAYFSKRRESE